MEVKHIKSSASMSISLTLAISVTLFLFYIDEGYYNFKWMLNWGNLMAFVIYVSLLFSAQWLVIKGITYKNEIPLVRTIKYIAGIIIGLSIAFWCMS